MTKRWLPTLEELEAALIRWVEWCAQSNGPTAEEYVDKLRAQNPGMSPDDLARMIVRRKALKCGLVGAVTGVPGLLALPATVSADLLACWSIQITMILAVARVYGHTTATTDLKTDILLVMAGDSAKEVTKRLGIEAGKHLTKRAVEQRITREMMKQIWQVLPPRIITKAGEKSLVSFTRAVPLVGAPIGFAFDWPAARVVGHTAVRYYSGRG